MYLSRFFSAARMKKQGGTDPIECRSYGCPIENDDHLFHCPRQPQFLCHIQSIIDDVQDTLDPKLYHLLKYHLTAYIQGRILLSITTAALTHKCRVSRSSLPRSCLKSLNQDANLYIDFVPHGPSRLTRAVVLLFVCIQWNRPPVLYKMFKFHDDSQLPVFFKKRYTCFLLGDKRRALSLPTIFFRHLRIIFIDLLDFLSAQLQVKF